jgi:hypothetical protein
MLAQFYLMNLSFHFEPDVSIEEVGGAIKRLASDFDFIRDNGDSVYRHESIYEEELISRYQIMDLYDITKPCPLPRDVKKYLLRVINHSRPTIWTNEEIVELITQQEQEDLCASKEVYGLLALQVVPHEVPEVYIVYDQRDWLAFHRYFLAGFPCDEGYFMSECEKCFPTLFFHPRNERVISQMAGGWRNFCKAIVYHLSQLNDVFPEYLQNRENYQRIEALREFSLRCRVDATPQGSAEAKPFMTFSFYDDEGNEVSICCEPHLKLSQSDQNGDNTFYFNRIYFHEGREIIQSGKILVGHIGRHIDFG